MSPTLVIRDLAWLLTMNESLGEGRLGAIPEAAIALAGERVVWIGPSREAPACADTRSRPGCIGLPGLVDAHTHAVWAGSRADEFERRLAGASYSEILEQGGGILSTVAATRATPLEQLTATCAARLRRLAARGTTTVEIKSGYGLSPVHEETLLRAARAAGAEAGVRVLTTFLGAHTIPAEHRADRSAYVAQILEEQLPRCAPHADFVDVYVDRGAFTVEEGRRVLQAGQARGLKARIHAEQVTHTGAAAMAAELGALSADHLEQIDDAGIAAMAEAGTVAMMLPGAMLYLGDPPPPVARLREAGVPLAVATDLNPGTSPVHDLWAAATLACVAQRLTVEEALLGITAHGARALGRPDLGRLAIDGPGDVVVARPAPGEPPTPAALIQHLGGTEVVETISRRARPS